MAVSKRQGFLGSKGEVSRESGPVTQRLIEKLERRIVDLESVVDSYRRDTLQRIEAGGTAQGSTLEDSGTGGVIPRWSGTGPSTTLEDSVKIVNNAAGTFINVFAALGSPDPITGLYAGSLALFSGDPELGEPGSVYLSAGAASGSGSAPVVDGASIGIQSGNGTGTGSAGGIVISGGSAGSGGNGTGGGIIFFGGNGGGTGGGQGGNVEFRGGRAQSGNANGGDVILQGGLPHGSGTVGKIYLNNQVYNAQFKMDLLSADRDLSLPDNDGTLALLSDIGTYENPLTFEGGLARSGDTVTVDQSFGFEWTGGQYFYGTFSFGGAGVADHFYVKLGDQANGWGVTFGETANDLIGWWGVTPSARSTGWSGVGGSGPQTIDVGDYSGPDAVLADVIASLIETLKTYGLLGA